MWDYFQLYPAEVVRGLTRVPAVALVIAAALASAVLWRSGARPPSAPTDGRSRLEGWVISLAALGVLAVYLIEYVVRGYLLNLMNIVEWWQYATPVCASTVALGAVLVVLLRSPLPEVRVAPSARRTWLSFSSRGGLLGVGAAVLGLAGVTVAAGSASSADTDGRFILLDLVAPNTMIDVGQPWFYGWSFGVPVLLALVALAIVTALTLRANAERPFRRPETVLAEQTARRAVAAGIARIATAGALLALAGALRFIERAGTIGTVTFADTGRSYETPWRWAEFAVIGGWLSPVLDIVAFVSLLLLAARPVRVPVRRATFRGAAPDRVR